MTYNLSRLTAQTAHLQELKNIQRSRLLRSLRRALNNLPSLTIIIKTRLLVSSNFVFLVKFYYSTMPEKLQNCFLLC